MSRPIVAIVGRPNVGKSALFNRITGKKISIVEDTPGVTRDRIYAEAEWRGRVFTVIDTGGIEPYSDDVILSQMRRQAQIAIDNADVIIFLGDIQTGVTAADLDIASMLKRSGKKVVLAVNKADRIGGEQTELYEFYNLGLGQPLPVSALHGYGSGELLDRVFENFPPQEEEECEDEAIKVAVIGKPNVGKSSLINRILGEERLIVSDIPGTTREAVDTVVERDGQRYVFIDTAGIRRKSKVEQGIERYSVLRSYMAVERADVAIIMIDASEGVSEQDAKIAGLAHERGKGSIIAVNKWDAVEKDDKTMDRYREKVMESLSFMTYAPVVFISAKTGQRVEGLFERIRYVCEQNRRRIATGALNAVLSDAMARMQPPSDKGRRLKIYYMTQASTKPPTFVAFVNRPEIFHYSYQRYIENQIRSVFGLEGTPVRLMVRERGGEK